VEILGSAVSRFMLDRTRRHGTHAKDDMMTTDSALVTSLVDHYQRLRQKQRALYNDLMDRLPEGLLVECAERLGIASKDQGPGRPLLIFDDEHEMSVLMDYCIYHGRRDGQTVIDRMLAESPPPAGTDELVLLQAMQQVDYSMFMVEKVIPGLGVSVRDALHDEQFVLVDLGLSQSATPGFVLAGNLVSPAGITMTTGAILPVDLDSLVELRAELDEQFHDASSRDPASDPELQAELAALVIRACLATGASSQVIEKDVPVSTRASRTSAKGHARNMPCPCGSGKKYKRCCG